MSRLWTPSGEHEPSQGSEAGGAGEPGAEDPAPATPEELTPQEQAEYAEMLATRAELAAVPVADIVANHAVGLWQLAILHLTPDPAPDGTPAEPRLAEASLAIDALGALVDTLGDRLAPNDVTLREAVAQLRLAFVQLSGGPPSPPTP